MKKIVIIGAGVAGLAAGIRLRALGYDVCIFEKEKKPGGRMHHIGGEGFTFDLGPTIVMMPQIYRDVFAAAGRNPADYLAMEQVNPMFKLYFPDGDSFSMSSDLVELTALLDRFGGNDTQGYLAYLADVFKRYQVAKEEFIEKSFRGAGDFYNTRSLIAALKLRTFDSAYESLKKFVRNEKLRRSLAFQTLYIGISPYNGPSIYTIIPMIELLYGVWHVKGGMNAVATAMVRLFAELGGRLYLESSVDEILIEDKRAKGVKLGDRQVLADFVLCAADFPYAVTSLIKEDINRGKYTPDKVKAMEYSCSAFLLYLGIGQKCPSLGLHNVWFAQDFDRNISDIFDRHVFPEDPSLYIYCPSRIDDSVAPPGKEGLYILVPVPELSRDALKWDDLSIKARRDEIVGIVSRAIGMPDLPAKIDFEAIVTPVDLKERFNAYNGAAFGLKPTLMQSNYFRPHNKYDYCEGLYFAGASAHPGAGVPIVLTSAKLAVQEILRDDVK